METGPHRSPARAPSMSEIPHAVSYLNLTAAPSILKEPSWVSVLPCSCYMAEPGLKLSA